MKRTKNNESFNSTMPARKKNFILAIWQKSISRIITVVVEAALSPADDLSLRKETIVFYPEFIFGGLCSCSEKLLSVDFDCSL